MLLIACLPLLCCCCCVVNENVYVKPLEGPTNSQRDERQEEKKEETKLPEQEGEKSEGKLQCCPFSDTFLITTISH